MNQKSVLLLFDIDGTLTDSVSQCHAAFAEALQASGLEKLDLDFNSYLHHTDSYIFQQNYERNHRGTMPAQALQDFEVLLLERMKAQAGIQEIKGALALMAHVQKLNQPYVLATGAMLSAAQYKMREAGMPYHEKLLASANLHFSREGILKAAVRLAEQHFETDGFDRIISFGDGWWDLKTAQNLGYEFVGIGKRHIDMLKAEGVANVWKDWRQANWETLGLGL